MDLSTRVSPTARLDGLDISLQATPPTEWLPTNVKMRHWNIREPVPDDLVEKYDVVHVRYLCLVLSNQEVPDVLQSIVRLISGYYSRFSQPAANTPNFSQSRVGIFNGAS